MELLERIEPFRLTNQQFGLLPLQVGHHSAEGRHHPNGGWTKRVHGNTEFATNQRSINFTKTGNVVTGSFIDNWNLDVTSDLVLTNTLTTGAGSDASAILNTLIQSSQVVSSPEPAALELLGIALTGLAAFGLRRKS